MFLQLVRLQHLSLSSKSLSSSPSPNSPMPLRCVNEWATPGATWRQSGHTEQLTSWAPNKNSLKNTMFCVNACVVPLRGRLPSAIPRTQRGWKVFPASSLKQTATMPP